MQPCHGALLLIFIVRCWKTAYRYHKRGSKQRKQVSGQAGTGNASARHGIMQYRQECMHLFHTCGHPAARQHLSIPMPNVDLNAIVGPNHA